MSSLRTWSKWLSAAACLCGTLALAQETPQEPANAVPTTPARIRVVTSEGNAEQNNLNNTFSVLVESPNPAAGVELLQAEPGKFWIGLICVEANETLREQFGLDANVGLGLVVESISDDAPAKKAGVQKNDVLLSATYPVDDAKGETKPLNQIGNLVAAVQKAETKPLKLLLLRKGQKQIVEVTPAERPQTPIAVQVRRFGPAEQQLQAILEAQRKQADGQANQAHRAWGTAMRMAGPMYVPPHQAPKLPEGMAVEFRQVVGQPERVLVSKGDQKWEATTDDLSKLPAEVRGPVVQQLTFRRLGAAMGHGMTVSVPAQPVPPGAGGFTPMQPTVVAVPTTVHVESHASTNLPDDLSVSITKKGSEPAKINVKKGDQTWEVSEKELDKLPPDVRKQVEIVIAQGFGTRAVMTRAAKVPNEQQIRHLYDAIRPENQVRPQAWPPTQPNNQLQERQDAMLKQLQQLTEKVEKLQQALEKTAPKQ